MTEILTDKLDDLLNAYNGLRFKGNWTLEYDSRVGSVGITNGEFMVYCTPFWEGVNGIPCSEYDTSYSSFIPVDQPINEEELKLFFDKYLSNTIPFIITCFERFIEGSFQYSN